MINIREDNEMSKNKKIYILISKAIAIPLILVLLTAIFIHQNKKRTAAEEKATAFAREYSLILSKRADTLAGITYDSDQNKLTDEELDNRLRLMYLQEENAFKGLYSNIFRSKENNNGQAYLNFVNAYLVYMALSIEKASIKRQYSDTEAENIILKKQIYEGLEIYKNLVIETEKTYLNSQGISGNRYELFKQKRFTQYSIDWE